MIWIITGLYALSFVVLVILQLAVIRSAPHYSEPPHRHPHTQMEILNRAAQIRERMEAQYAELENLADVFVMEEGFMPDTLEGDIVSEIITHGRPYSLTMQRLRK